MLTYPEMIVVGLLQGVSELFPVSSLGHSVLVPALVGGTWAGDLNTAAPDSAYLDSLVAMHVATAAALVVFFARDWARILRGLGGSIRHRRIDNPDARLAWLLVAGTVPVGIAGLALDRIVREDLAQPVPAAVFLTLNGVVLFAVERWRRARAMAAPMRTLPAAGPGAATAEDADLAGDRRLARLSVRSAVAIGACQIMALLPGFSRSGVTMAGGLLRGLRHEDAARFAFLLATPVIAAAGLLKLPELARPELRGAFGPTVVGSVVAGVGAYLSVRYLVRYFRTRTLTPFAWYCVVVGLGCLLFLVTLGPGA